MQRALSWNLVSREQLQLYYQRHIYQGEPEDPPPYEDDGPEIDWNDVPSTNPELLCSRCMLAVLKIYSNRDGTGAFGLFLPPARTCVLCKLILEIQNASRIDHESRVFELMRVRIPHPNLSRAPPAHMKDIVVLFDASPISNLEHGTRVVSKMVDFDGIRAIPKQQLDPSVVRSWLSECESTHGEGCCGATNRVSLDAHRIWLIDTRHFCLVQKPLPCRYVTLSYVWGKVQTFRLKEKDIPSLSTLEGLRDIEDQLPLTIMDAIEFVRSIGEKYLWVDAVCIPQDNAKIMEEQIGHMASVYRSSILTLVAVASDDARSPLPGVRAGTRSLRSFFETPDLTLAERLTSILPVILSSNYNTRAWTFQERLLSTRCLYFTGEQAFLQCQSGIFREDRVAHTAFEKLGRDIQALKPLSPALIESQSPTGSTGLAKNFQLYRQIVEEYTTKSLSYDADILHAFTGVAEELEPLVESPLVAAMPEKFFIRSMLFQPKRRAFTKRTAEMKHLEKRTNELVNLSFPSWSWCGWVGPVEYKNVGSIIAHASRIQICTALRSNKQPVEFRFFEQSIEPRSHGFEVDFAGLPKPALDVQPFTLRFMASVDVSGSFNFEPSVRGDNYLSVTGPNSLTCGLIRIDDPRASQHSSGRSKPNRKETKNSCLVLLCDIEMDLIREPDEPDGSHQRKPWGPKLYYDGSPWKLCAVLYVGWKGGVAERLGIGEVTKEDWRRSNAVNQVIYLA
ncbi:uncharacterized protein PV09_08247 [Verruconis gallopava]|uniref:Heterokaryon incompatibility domain-containing protein n=1 Tax=Verruconis gallopava TaxID=253628 RepID=A0A0D1YH99_9PEZI|nr:uncharacterized protein PV09_08247 [Verruconis gallopava]KIW00207.1 hypothetical protein PV09_08247 [Verruconis gallopava]